MDRAYRFPSPLEGIIPFMNEYSNKCLKRQLKYLQKDLALAENSMLRCQDALVEEIERIARIKDDIEAVEEDLAS